MFNANLVHAFFFCLSLLSLSVCACGVCARTALVIMCWLTSLPLCKRETTSPRSFPSLHRICAFLCVKARGFHGWSGPVSFIQICKQVGGKHDFSSFFFISELDQWMVDARHIGRVNLHALTTKVWGAHRKPRNAKLEWMA